MTDLTLPHRVATPDDATALTELVNMAGEGVPFHLWQGLAEEGQSAWDVGRARALRDEGGFSYRNAVVREENGRVVAALIGYPLAAEPVPVGDDTAAMFVPLQELENMAPATWYVNVLATYPEHRGRGYGAALLAIADRIAADSRLRGLSIIVSDGNPGARRLYERSGYREIASRPMVKDDWESPGENWVLLIREPS
ncbi:MAG: GNAT family N-acetyltransferase [Pseudomonadota bacterium]